MDILVGIHIGSDFNDGGINCAKLSLNESGIRHILKLADRARKGQTISEFDYTPELGITDLDLDNRGVPYLDIAKLSEEESQQAVFGTPDENDFPPRIDVSEIHVDKEDFWFEGRFKHTGVHWETRVIPLSFLSQDLRAAPQSGKKEYKPMTPAETNQLTERIAKGIASGLNAREIAQSFNRHVTLEQLVLCIHDLLLHKED